MSNRFQYQPRPTENWQKREEQTGGGFIGFLQENVATYQAKKNENWLRALPPTWPNPKHYGYDIWVHYGVGPQNASVLCNLKMNNDKCTICETFTKADSEGRDDAYDYKATRRVLCWLIDRKEEKPDSKPVAWAMPWTLDRDLSKLCRDRQTGELYQIDNPDTGFDFSFDREGELPNIKYVGIQLSRRPSPVADQFLNYIMEHPLPTILLKRSYEEVRALFEGGTAVTDKAPIQNSFQGNINGQTATESKPPWEQPTNVSPTPEASFCSNTVSVHGQVLGCSFISGHSGICDFTVMKTQPSAAQQTSPPSSSSQAGMFNSPPQQSSPAPQTTSAPSNSRTAALKERFAQR